MTDHRQRDRLLRLEPERLRDRGGGDIERTEVARPGRDGRRQRHARGEERRLRRGHLDAQRLTGGGEPDDGSRPGHEAEDECLDERPWPACHRQPAVELSRELADGRPAVREGADPLGSGQPVRDHEQGQHHDEERRHGEPEQDGARNEAADLEDHDGKCRDGHDDRRVDDPLHDDGAERRRATDALAVPEVVAADELAEAGRQDVIGEIPDEQVLEGPVERDRRDRREQPLPAQAACAEVCQDEQDHHPEPCEVRATDVVAHLGEVDAIDDDDDRDERDRDPEEGAEGSAAGQRGFRFAMSFGDRRTRSRWSMNRTITLSVDSP